ncbi:hypothetical protein E2C01_008056 [Portunus trituberculatus]|uniref:Uncharacterized protein n=1 Tax=Portunus trituberculatus TaxID=210409 RepID=A0A5B7D0M0_PORTR|nr:hypothetical protein [Portunus trituberculatus]
MRKPQRQLVSPMNKGTVSAAPPRGDDNWVSVESGPEGNEGGFLNVLDNANTHSGEQHPSPPLPRPQEYATIFVFRAWHRLLRQFFSEGVRTEEPLPTTPETLRDSSSSVMRVARAWR